MVDNFFILLQPIPKEFNSQHTYAYPRCFRTRHTRTRTHTFVLCFDLFLFWFAIKFRCRSLTLRVAAFRFCSDAIRFNQLCWRSIKSRWSMLIIWIILWRERERETIIKVPVSPSTCVQVWVLNFHKFAQCTLTYFYRSNNEWNGRES